jgi:hypothetical protein
VPFFCYSPLALFPTSPLSTLLRSLKIRALLFFLFYSYKSYSNVNPPPSIVSTPPPPPTKKVYNNWEMKEDSSRKVFVAAFELMRNNVGWRKSFNAVSM